MAADFGCGVSPSIGDYIGFQCRRGIQNTYGYLAEVRASTGTVVAVTRLDTNIKTRWCAIHQTLPMYDQPALNISTHDMDGQTGAEVGVCEMVRVRADERMVM